MQNQFCILIQSTENIQIIYHHLISTLTIFYSVFIYYDFLQIPLNATWCYKSCNSLGFCRHTTCTADMATVAYLKQDSLMKHVLQASFESRFFLFLDCGCHHKVRDPSLPSYLFSWWGGGGGGRRNEFLPFSKVLVWKWMQWI